MNEKKFAIVFFCFAEIFFLCNIVFWHMVVKPTFVDYDGHGDLTRLAGYDGGHPMTRLPRYARRHIRLSDYLQMENKPPIDIITIGDSFFNGTAGTWYQDYLAEKYGKNVIHIHPAGCELAELLMLIEKEGLLQEIAPKAVVLGSVERRIQNRFGGRTLKVPTISKEVVIKNNMNVREGTGASGVGAGFIPDVMWKANKKYLNNKVKYWKDPKRLSEDVQKEMLVTPFFTNPGQENTLLLFHDDFWYRDGEADYEKINGVMNSLAGLCAKHNIRFVFMPCVDKFDLYYPYLQDRDSYKENLFFETFETYPKQYICINTKRILREMLEEGERDVYWMDDTHWSWKAQQRVADALMKELDGTNPE